MAVDKLYYQNLPKKRTGVGILFVNEGNEILIVKPKYKDHWTLPGGVVDQDESPRRASIREIEEELSLKISVINLLCIDYISSTQEKDENLQFVFYGGRLKSTQIQQIKFSENEISECKFLKAEDALNLVSEKLKRRLPHCLSALTNKTVYYLENGTKI